MPFGEQSLAVRSEDEAESKMTRRLRSFARVLDRERDARIGDVEDRPDAPLVVPLPRDGEADVDFVLVIGDEKLDRPAEHRAAEILNGHPRHFDRTRAREIRVGAGLIVHDPDREGIGGARERRGAGQNQRQAEGDNSPEHGGELREGDSVQPLRSSTSKQQGRHPAWSPLGQLAPRRLMPFRDSADSRSAPRPPRDRRASMCRRARHIRSRRSCAGCGA